jgi:DNA-binding transcriptional regulator GbsR (MarR family)
MASIQQETIEVFEDLLEKQGHGRMLGQVLATIYLKEVPMTQEQLEKESNFSRSSINKAVNDLLNLGYIRKRQLGEGKKLVYYTEWGPKEIFLWGIEGYLAFFDKIISRFSKIFESTSKVEGLPLKKVKEFVDHLPEVKKRLEEALKDISKLELALK